MAEVPSLLSICVRAVADGLHDEVRTAALLPTIPSVPEPELARQIWRAYQLQLAASEQQQQQQQPQEQLVQLAPGAHAAPPQHLWSRLYAVARAFAAFWQPATLRLVRLPDLSHALCYLPSVAQRLQHLELSEPRLHSLAALAACPALRCLSLRGCTGLDDGSLAVLPTGCSGLQALDLGGLGQLTDAAAAHMARLPALVALNCSGTAFSDRALEALAYGHTLRAWARREARAPPAELAASWPALPLRVLRVASCLLTPAGLHPLADLPSLVLLDVRWTRMPAAALQPLQQRFGLRLIQGAVLTASNALAAAVVNHDALACTCQPPPDARTPVEAWAAEGAQLLLRACPSRGIHGFLEQQAQEGAPGGAGQNGRELGVSGASESPALQRRRGLRAPRDAKRPRRVASGAGQGKGEGRQLPSRPQQEQAGVGGGAGGHPGGPSRQHQHMPSPLYLGGGSGPEALLAPAQTWLPQGPQGSSSPPLGQWPGWAAAVRPPPWPWPHHQPAAPPPPRPPSYQLDSHGQSQQYGQWTAPGGARWGQQENQQ